MLYDDDNFGPCDCGEIECWSGNAEITRNDAGVSIRHSRYQCRPVKPKPGPAPASPGNDPERKGG